MEHAAGRPSTDIRLTSEIMQRMRRKIAELGLDPEDTTGPELYGVLHERLKHDEQVLREALGIQQDALADAVIEQVRTAVTDQDMPKKIFALKGSIAKRLLKKKLPKNAMKALGYRSADSMLKHEPVAAVYAVARIVEPDSWHRTFREQYNKLSPSDFEMRQAAVLHPSAKRWQELAAGYVGTTKHNIMTFPELGAVVLLPLDHQVDGLAMTTLLLTLEELNGVRAYSSYAKLQQVRPNFGAIIRHSSVTEPFTGAKLAGQPVPWRMIQRYYARFGHAYHPEIFEPHVQADDLQWHNGEDTLAALAPELAFWQDTRGLGMMHNGEIVSCNALDVALGYCNHLAFAERIVHFMRDNVWHELMMRYLNQENLEAVVHRQLSAELAPQALALAEQESYNEA